MSLFFSTGFSYFILNDLELLTIPNSSMSSVSQAVPGEKNEKFNNETKLEVYFWGSNIQHTLKDRYVISFSVSAPLELLMECISFITQRMCCIKRSLPIALKLNFSGSHDALSKESKMLQSKRSSVGKSPKQTSSSRKAKSLALLVAHGNCSLQGSVVW